MNRRMLYTQQGETFEIRFDRFQGYRIFQVLTEKEAKAVSGYYANAGELLDGLCELAILNEPNEAVSIATLCRDLRATMAQIRHYLQVQQW